MRHRILVVALVAFAGRAYADKAAAEAAFDQATALVNAHNFRDACPLFESSYKADPQLGVLLNLADCHEQIGRTATAWVEFRDAIQLASSLGDPREAYAKRRVELLAPRLARLRVTLPPSPSVAGLVVKRDDSDISILVGTDMPVDPGEHAVSATAPGYVGWSTKVLIANAPKTTEVAIPALVKLSVTPSVTSTSVGSPATAFVEVEPAHVEPPQPRTPLRVYLVFVGGALKTEPRKVIGADGVTDCSKFDLGPTSFAGGIGVAARYLFAEHWDAAASIGVNLAGLQAQFTSSPCLGSLSGLLAAVPLEVLIRWRPGAWLFGIGPELGFTHREYQGTLESGTSMAERVDQLDSAVTVGAAFEIGRTFGSDEKWQVAARIIITGEVGVSTSYFGSENGNPAATAVLRIGYAIR